MTILVIDPLTTNIDQAIAQLRQYRAELELSSLYVKWKAANPREAAVCEAYWDDPYPVPTPVTAFGQSLAAAITAWHYLVGDHP